MKVRTTKSDGFVPFDVILSIENEEEARAIYAIFNYFPNVELLPEGVSPVVRKEIGEKFGNLPPSNEIARGVTYDKFYSRKVKP